MRFSTGIRKRFITGSATKPGGSCDPTGSTSSARGRQGWETGQSSSTYSPGRMKRQCDTPGNSSGPTKSGKRSRKLPMLDTATLSEKSRTECSHRQAPVPLFLGRASYAKFRKKGEWVRCRCLTKARNVIHAGSNGRIDSNNPTTIPRTYSSALRDTLVQDPDNNTFALFQSANRT